MIKAMGRRGGRPQRRMALAWPWTMLVWLLLSLAAAACSDKDESGRGSGAAGGGAESAESDAGGAEKAQAIPVQVEPATQGDIAQTLLATTHVQPRHEVRVVARAAGACVEVKAEEGDAVRHGQLLAKLDNPELSIALSTAQGNVSRLRREVANIKPLVDKGYVARQNLDELRFQLKQAQDQAARLQVQVGDLTVRAPIDGVVATRTARVGQQISPGVELFHVVNPDQLDAVVNIPERSLVRLREGSAAYLISDALAGARFEGRVRLINPVVDSQSGTVKVTVEVLNPAPEGAARIRPGMFTTVHLITDQHLGATLIPKRAVLYDDNTPYAYVITGADDAPSAQKRPLKLGFSEQTTIEVLDGVKPGEPVVTIGQGGLTDATPVQVVARSQPNDAAKTAPKGDKTP